WSRHIADITFQLQPLNAGDRAAAIKRFAEWPRRVDHPPPFAVFVTEGFAASGGPGDPLPPPSRAGIAGTGYLAPPPAQTRTRTLFSPAIFIAWLGGYDFEPTLKQQLASTLGSTFGVTVAPTTDASKPAIGVGGPIFDVHSNSPAQLYDVTVRFPDG